MSVWIDQGGCSDRMLEQVLTHLHNWFQVDIRHGAYAIKDGLINLPFLQEGQYFRILGSAFNDGLHRYGPEMELLQDEAFEGSVWALAIPRAVIELAGEIAQWQEKYRDTLESPYTSESYGGYLYNKPSAVESGGAGWQAAFRARLNPYRKLREI